MNSIFPYPGKNFFGPTNPPTPNEILSKVISYIPPREKPDVGLVNKDWREVYINDQFWRGAGANNYQDFINRMSALPDKFKNLICNQIYDLPLAEQCQKIFQESRERKEELLYELVPGLATANLDADQLDSVLTDNGVQALVENLITAEQAAGLNCYQLDELLSDNGLQALREGLVKPEQAINLDYDQLRELLDENGLDALREGLITPEQAVAIPYDQLTYLLNAYGSDALREGLITLEQVVNIDFTDSQLSVLLDYDGLQALREGLITPEQAAEIYSDNLEYLLYDNGIQALREGLITPEQVADMDQGRFTVLSKNGLQALREGLITPDQANNISDAKLQDLRHDHLLQRAKEARKARKLDEEPTEFEIKKRQKFS